MPTIVIVGAGPRLGLSIGKVFGANAFSVALVSRNRRNVDRLAAELNKSGIKAAGFDADVMDRLSMVRAFDGIKDLFGHIDVLEYSPAPHDSAPNVSSASPMTLAVENIQPQLDYYLYGAIAATQQVLPDMIVRGSGTLLYTTGTSSMDAMAVPPEFTTNAIATTALRTWVLKLHQATAGTGVYAAHVPLLVRINGGSPETTADAIAQRYWRIHIIRDGAEHSYMES